VTSSGRRAAAWALVAAVGSARVVTAQLPATAPIAPEARLDVIAGHDPAIQLGAGVQIPVGYYARIGVDAALGVPIRDRALSTERQLDGRVDLLARFLLDPFRQTAYGLSLGGGASVRAEHGDRARPFLLVALDVEGRRSTKGVVPALQVGLGGGVRVGVVLRRAAAGAR
jgi:hypothetical protein